MSNREFTQEANLFNKSQGDLKRAMDDALASPRWLALAYLFALILAELFTTLVDPRLGMLLHALLLITLLINTAIIGRGPVSKFLLALALAPLIRVVSLSMPLPRFPFIYWYLIVGAPLLLAALVAARHNRMSRGMMGLKWRALPWQMVIAITGIGLGFIEYLILRPEPLIAEFSWRQIIIPALVLLIFTGFLEEFIFRGVLQYTSLRNLGRFGLFYVAAIFAVLHFGYQSIIDIIFVFVVALFFGFATLRTGSILGASLSHGLTNITLFLVFPFLIASPTTQLAAPEEIEFQQEIVTTVSITPTPEIIGPALWAPAPQKILTATPNIPQATVTLSPTLPPATATLVPTDTPSPPPTATAAPQTCNPPAGWIRYVVKRGDTLWSISQAFGTSVQKLRSANCITGQGINPGMTIYVPYVPPTQPPPTATKQPPTNTPIPPTVIPTNTLIPPTNTPILHTPTFAPTEVPPTSAPTEVPPASTMPPATNTPSPVPPTSTPTLVPPTSTNTPIPPSATFTSAPPTSAVESTPEF